MTNEFTAILSAMGNGTSATAPRFQEQTVREKLRKKRARALWKQSLLSWKIGVKMLFAESHQRQNSKP